MSTFTPGPWKFKPCLLGHPNNRLNPIVTSECGSVARLFHSGSTIAGMTSLAPSTLDEAEANARLIAAAPELLEACLDVESKLVDYEAERINWRPDDFLQRVRAAIAKATETT